MTWKTRPEKSVREDNVPKDMYDSVNSLVETTIDLTTFSKNVDISSELTLPYGSVILTYVKYRANQDPEFVIIQDNMLEVLEENGCSKDLDLRALDYETKSHTLRAKEQTPGDWFNFVKMDRMELENNPFIVIFASRFGISSRRLVKYIFEFAPKRKSDVSEDTKFSEHDIALTSHT